MSNSQTQSRLCKSALTITPKVKIRAHAEYRLRGPRLYRVYSDSSGAIYARLRDTATTIVADARSLPPHSSTAPNPTPSWLIRYRLRNGKFAPYSTEPDRRRAIVQLKHAAIRALDDGWYHVLLSEMDVLLNRAHLGSTISKPSIIPIGSSTALIAVAQLATIFGADRSSTAQFLESIKCPVVQAPNGLDYFSLWMFEICLISKLLKVDFSEAAELLVQAQTVYKLARKEAALNRLQGLAADLLQLKP